MITSLTLAAGLSFIELALVIFLFAFACITISLFVRRRPYFQRAASIPLEDAPRVKRHSNHGGDA